MGASVRTKNGVLYTVIIILAIPLSLSVIRDIRQRASGAKTTPAYIEQTAPARSVPSLSPARGKKDSFFSPAAVNLPGGAYDTPVTPTVPAGK